MTNIEIMDHLEGYNFECRGGPLSKCVDWQTLRERLAAPAETRQSPVCTCRNDSGMSSVCDVHFPAAVTPPKELCLCAAIKMADGYIVRGHRHDDAIMCAMEMPRYGKGDLHKAVQGFMTTSARFVDRTEGAELQRAAGIVSAYTGQLPHDLLFSEDLYMGPVAPPALKEDVR